ncbi:unnamed protein product, partial [Rhizoctonia solani]
MTSKPPPRPHKKNSHHGPSLKISSANLTMLACAAIVLDHTSGVESRTFGNEMKQVGRVVGEENQVLSICQRDPCRAKPLGGCDGHVGSGLKDRRVAVAKTWAVFGFGGLDCV